MNEKIVKCIQYHFKKITNYNIEKYHVNKFIIPVINHINNNESNKFLLSGSQGIGKSTLLKIIEIVFKKFYKKKILTLFLDDFYFRKNERKILANSTHPLLITRGVPGTHNIKQLLKIIDKFEKIQYPIKLPVFNKLQDTRIKKKRIINNKCEILILEGWCVGCTPLTNKFLFSDSNMLEKKYDKDKKWRIYYNNQLKTNYLQLFNKFNSIIFMKSPSFSYVLEWRLKQENHLKKINKKNRYLAMNKKEVMNFIQYYEKITKWMLKKMPNSSDLVIYVNKKQKIFRIKKNKTYTH